MKVTLKEIADRANVSVSSVSRALNGGWGGALVHGQTRERILRIAKEMGYHRLHSSQQPDRSPKFRIGLVLHDVKVKYHDPYFSELMYGIESELAEQGLGLDFTLEVQEIFQSRLFAGVEKRDLAVLCVGPLKSEFLQELKRHVPLVFSVGGLKTPGVDCVSVDFRGAAREAVQYLIGLGHRRIAFLGGSSVVGASLEEEERFIAYKEVLASHGISLNQTWICNGGFDPAKAYEVMTELIRSDKRPTAVFAASDRMAYGAYKAIQENGFTVPEDVSVLSFDDIEMSEFLSPGLTTVRVHKEAMGRIAVKLLVQRMEGKLPLPLTSYLPTELVVRGSCNKYDGFS